MSSYLDICLKPSIAGPPRTLCEEELTRILEVAQGMILVLRMKDLEDLASVTLGWGLSFQKIRKMDITLLILLTDPLPQTEGLFGRGKPLPQLHSSAYKRFQWIRTLVDQGRLKVRCRRLAEEDPDPIRLDGWTLTHLLTDADGNIVRMGWSVLPLEEGLPEASAELSWSFGDPRRRARTAWEQSQGWMAREVKPGEAEQEQAFLQMLDPIPPDCGDWEETFDEEVPLPFRLFDHQQEALKKWFAHGMKGLFEMCTGAGKTITSLACVWHLVREFQKEQSILPVVLVTVPTRVLADQWCEEIQKMGFRAPVRAYNSHDAFMPDLRDVLDIESSEHASLVVTTYKSFAHLHIQHLLSLAQRRNREILWIADEAHNLSTSRLQDCMRDLSALFVYRIALTATPEIEGLPDRSKALLDYFGGVIAQYTLKDGIEDGVLCPYRYQPQPVYLNPELGAKYLSLLQQIEAPDPNQKVSMDLYRQKRDLVRQSGVQLEAFKAIVKQIQEEGGDLHHTLIYCPPGFASKAEEAGADESDDVAEEMEESRLIDEVTQFLISQGFEAARILGETSASDRERTLRDFRDGRIHALCAIGCLDEGVDIPSIQRAIVLYSVDREKQFIQRRGRILRQSKDGTKKIAQIMDVVVLPQGSSLSQGQAAGLLRRELRRYQSFANLALNRDEAQEKIEKALEWATQQESN